MLRLLFAMVATVAVVLFVMVNTHHVALSFVFGPPIKVRLIFLLMLTFILGALVATFGGMVARVRARRRTRAHTSRAARERDDDDEMIDDPV